MMIWKNIGELKIQIAILTVPADFAKEIAEESVRFGIKGILNFTRYRLMYHQVFFLKSMI